MATLDNHLRQMLAMVRDVFEGEPAYAYYGFYGQLEWYHRQGLGRMIPRYGSPGL